MQQAPWYRWDGTTLVLEVHVQPRASCDEIIGPHGGRLKIRMTAPPVDGAANARLQTFLTGQFRVSRSRVQLTRGLSGRDKQLRIREPRRLLPGISRPS